MKLLGGLEQPITAVSTSGPGIRVSLLRQEPEFGPDADADGGRQVGPGLAPRPPARARGSGPGDGRGRGRGRPRAGQRAATTSCTTSSSTRTPTRSIIASRRSSPACGSPQADFDRPARTFSGGQQSRLMLAKLLAREPRPDAPGRAVEPPRYRDDRMARELPGAPARGDGRRQPRPLLPRQGRHQDLGAARGEDQGLSRQLHAVLAAPDREGQGPRAAGRAAGREGRRSSRPTSASTARASGPSRPTTASGSSSDWSASGSRRCARSSGR